jgi:DNA-binding beta-propeller fold protein YncE
MTVESLTDGGFCFLLVPGWGQLPDGWSLGEAAGVGVDSADNVYVFNRGEHPMVVFDRDGCFLRSWGEGTFVKPHGIHIGRDGAIYCTDDGDHSVRKCDPFGKVLLTIGVPGKASPVMSGRPFHRCTHTALSPSGDIYVSDGYGNACIHKYSPDGTHLMTWGRSGSRPGEFYIPHNLCCDDAGWIYVGDRENHRVQVFNGDGAYETQWNNLHRPCALCEGIDRDRTFYVGEVGPAIAPALAFPNLGPRLSVVDENGRLLARLGDVGAGLGENQFIAPHGLAIDSHGDLYVVEVSQSAWPVTFPGRPLPDFVRSLRKLRRMRHSSAAKTPTPGAIYA